jgi:hypothetical protein
LCLTFIFAGKLNQSAPRPASQNFHGRAMVVDTVSTTSPIQASRPMGSGMASARVVQPNVGISSSTIASSRLVDSQNGASMNYNDDDLEVLAVNMRDSMVRHNRKQPAMSPSPPPSDDGDTDSSDSSDSSSDGSDSDSSDLHRPARVGQMPWPICYELIRSVKRNGKNWERVASDLRSKHASCRKLDGEYLRTKYLTLKRQYIDRNNKIVPWAQKQLRPAMRAAMRLHFNIKSHKIQKRSYKEWEKERKNDHKTIAQMIIDIEERECLDASQRKSTAEALRKRNSECSRSRTETRDRAASALVDYANRRVEESRKRDLSHQIVDLAALIQAMESELRLQMQLIETHKLASGTTGKESIIASLELRLLEVRRFISHAVVEFDKEYVNSSSYASVPMSSDGNDQSIDGDAAFLMGREQLSEY